MDTIVVFTGKSKTTILEEGGSSSWVINRANAARCKYVVCCRSAVDWVEGPEPKGCAFLLGRLGGIDAARDEGMEHRKLLRFSEYADILVPNAWDGWRNPVHYSTLDDLGIELSSVTFKPMPGRPAHRGEEDAARQVRLSVILADAKRGLARSLEVPEDAIEITIRA